MGASGMPPLGDEEVSKKRERITILTPNKSLIRILILLAQIKTGSKSFKLKNEIRQMLYLLHQEPYSKFVTRKWNIVHDQSNANYNVGNEIIYNTVVLNLIFMITTMLTL